MNHIQLPQRDNSIFTSSPTPLSPCADLELESNEPGYETISMHVYNGNQESKELTSQLQRHIMSTHQSINAENAKHKQLLEEWATLESKLNFMETINDKIRKAMRVIQDEIESMTELHLKEPLNHQPSHNPDDPLSSTVKRNGEHHPSLTNGPAGSLESNILEKSEVHEHEYLQSSSSGNPILSSRPHLRRAPTMSMQASNLYRSVLNKAFSQADTPSVPDGDDTSTSPMTFPLSREPSPSLCAEQQPDVNENIYSSSPISHVSEEAVNRSSLCSSGASIGQGSPIVKESLTLPAAPSMQESISAPSTLSTPSNGINHALHTSDSLSPLPPPSPVEITDSTVHTTTSPSISQVINSASTSATNLDTPSPTLSQSMDPVTTVSNSSDSHRLDTANASECPPNLQPLLTNLPTITRNSSIVSPTFSLNADESFHDALPRSSTHEADNTESPLSSYDKRRQVKIFSPSSFSLEAPAPSSPPVPMRSAHLFEHFLVLGVFPSPDTLCRNLPSWAEEPRILLSFPHHRRINAEEVASFAFPSGVIVQRLKAFGSNRNSLDAASVLLGQRVFTRGEHVHVFALKTVDQSESNLFIHELMYGISIQTSEVTIVHGSDGSSHEVICPTAYCFLSRYPFFSLHADVLFSLLMLMHLKRAAYFSEHVGESSSDPTKPRGKPLGPHQVGACVSLLKHYWAMRVPQPGSGLVLEVPSRLPSIVFERPVGHQFIDEIVGIREWACCLAWSFISAEQLLDLLEIAIREMKIIVADRNVAMLSSGVLSFIPLIAPLKWTSVILPILPMKLIEFLDSPVPILVGVVALPDHLNAPKKLDSNTAVWFPSANKIWLPANYKSLLPERSKLLSSLKRHLTNFRKSRTKSTFISTTSTTSTYIYKPTNTELSFIASMLSDIQEVLLNNCEYLLMSEYGRRDKKREPWANIMRQTQCASQWLEERESFR